MNTTENKPTVAPERLEAFPVDLYGMPDPCWLREIANLIAADLPYLTDDQKDCVYNDIVEARMCAFRSRHGADA